MGMQAVFLGQVDKFNKRLERIEKLIESTLIELSDEKKDLFGAVIQKLQENKDFELLAFLEGLHICMTGS
jgi:hypothetical protein